MEIIPYIIFAILLIALLAICIVYNSILERQVFLSSMYYKWYCSQFDARKKDLKLIKAQREYIELLEDERIELMAVYERWYGEPYKTTATELRSTIKELE